MRKLAYVIPGLILIGFIGTCVYFVSGVSATLPPIKRYRLTGSAARFVQNLSTYTARSPGVTYVITDTTGDAENGYAIYIDIKIKVSADSNLYNIKLFNPHYGRDRHNTDLELIGAFNTKNHQVGGYGISGTGVKMLVQFFDTAFLSKLRVPYKVI